jgi:hypothetical protein
LGTDSIKSSDDVSGAARPADEAGEALHDEPGPELEQAEASDALDSSAASLDIDATRAPPAAVAELAAACVRFVTARYGTSLDFAPDTLSLLDQWLRDARSEVEARPEAAEVVQSAAGAYLGEVIRRQFGAQWVVEGDVSSWRLCLSTVYCAFNPIGMAREALLLGPADGWHAHLTLDPGERDALEARLAALPPADDEEFYAPSTRFDVMSIIVAALRHSMRARALGDVRFQPADYD